MRWVDANMHSINWDNLRYVLAVARHGSIAAAARELSVNRSTVLRRISNFERELDCRIFERNDSGYALTLQAEKMMAAAREVESTLHHMQREIAGHELRLEGELRVTTTDGLMASIMGPVIASFHRKHPQIVIELSATNSILDLNRRDADIAVRPTQAPQPPLLGHRLRDVEFAVYASRDYLENNRHPDYLKHSWIGLDQSFFSSGPGQWFDANIPASQICLRADSFVSIRIAAENSLGMALLPRFIGDHCEALRATDLELPELTTGLWVLTHPDLMRAARIQAFIDHLRATLGSNDQINRDQHQQ